MYWYMYMSWFKKNVTFDRWIPVDFSKRRDFLVCFCSQWNVAFLTAFQEYPRTIQMQIVRSFLLPPLHVGGASKFQCFHAFVTVYSLLLSVYGYLFKDLFLCSMPTASRVLFSLSLYRGHGDLPFCCFVAVGTWQLFVFNCHSFW